MDAQTSRSPTSGVNTELARLFRSGGNNFLWMFCAMNIYVKSLTALATVMVFGLGPCISVCSGQDAANRVGDAIDAALHFHHESRHMPRQVDAVRRKHELYFSMASRMNIEGELEQLFGVKAHIVMPSNSPAVKKAGVKGYGGRIVECEPTLEARESTAEAVRSETKAVLIPPFNYAPVIAGQGTCAAEFFEQTPELDIVIAPVGGGGLISGTCISAAAQSPQVRVIAAEPSNADDAFQSKEAGKIIPQLNPDTIADGLRTSLGTLTWPFVRDHVESIVRIDESEIVEAMKLFIERTKILIEPSAAVSVAVALKHVPATEGPKRIGVILSGGNVDLDRLPW